MKKILLLLFLSASIYSQAQFPNTITSGNSSTLQKANGAFGGMLGYVFAGSYGDTTAANLSFIKNVPGIVIRNVDTLWMRNASATAWLKVNGSGISSGVNIYNSNGIIEGNRTLTGLNNTYYLAFDSLNYFRVDRNGVTRIYMNSAATQLSSPDGNSAFSVYNSGDYRMTGIPLGAGTKAVRYDDVIGKFYVTDTTSGGIAGGADSTYFLGSLYNKNTWSNLNDFNQVGGTYAVSSNKINFSGGANDYTNILEINRATRLEHWKMAVRTKVTSSLAINGFSIGIRNSNPAFANNFVAWFRPFDGYLRIEKVFNTPLATSASALSLSLSDEIEVTFERDVNNFYATARNITTNSAPITVSYRVEQLYSSSVLAPSTGFYSIYNIGGTFTVDSIAVESKELVNADALLIGTSKTVGYYGTTFENRWASRLNQDFNIVVSAGSADQTRQWNDAAAELIALNPKKVLIEAPSNDYREGVTEATIIANYDSLVTALQSAGIQVYHINYLYETGLDYTSWKTHINATYPSSNIIYTDTLSRRTGFLNADGIHISPDGQKWLYDLVNSFFVLKQFHGKPHVPFNSIYSPSEGVAVLRTPATNSFSQLKFGGETSSSPMLKVNGSGLDVRDASDGNYSAFRGKTLSAIDGSTELRLTTLGSDTYLDNYNSASIAGILHLRAGSYVFNNGSSDFLTINSSGQVIIPTLRTGISAPTTTGTIKMVITDQNGLQSFTTIPTGGFTTADNGLTASTSTNVQLGSSTNSGSPLTHTTYINTTANYALKINSSVPSATEDAALVVDNTAAGFGIGIKATSVNSAAVYGIGGTGVRGESVNGLGMWAISTNSTGLQVTSNNSLPAFFETNPAAGNTVRTILQLQRTSTSAGSTGNGSSIDFYNAGATANTAIFSNQLISKLTSVTASAETSQFIIAGVNVGSTVDLLTLYGEGAVKLNPITATAASAITAADGMLLYVSSTNGTFTSVGIWARENGAWVKL